MSRPPIFPKELRIWVSPSAIRDGVTKSGDKCPVGLTLGARYPSVYISERYAWVASGPDFTKAWAWYVIDNVGLEFIRKFDTSEVVNPVVISMVLVRVYRF